MLQMLQRAFRNVANIAKSLLKCCKDFKNVKNVAEAKNVANVAKTLTLPFLSRLVPTPFTKEGLARFPAISKTIAPMNLKFCRILETSLIV